MRPQAGLHLGVDGPGGGHVEAGIQECLDDRLPGFGRLVGEDDDGDPVVFEHPVDFTEGLGEPLLKALLGRLHAARLAGIGHEFL